MRWPPAPGLADEIAPHETLASSPCPAPPPLRDGHHGAPSPTHRPSKPGRPLPHSGGSPAGPILLGSWSSSRVDNHWISASEKALAFSHVPKRTLLRRGPLFLELLGSPRELGKHQGKINGPRG